MNKPNHPKHRSTATIRCDFDFSNTDMRSAESLALDRDEPCAESNPAGAEATGPASGSNAAARIARAAMAAMRLHRLRGYWGRRSRDGRLRHGSTDGEAISGEPGRRMASCELHRVQNGARPEMPCSDDLLLAAENHPDFEDTRLAFAFRSTDDLIRIATGADPLPIRALAAWYALGTDRRPSPRLSSKQGDPAAVFNALQEAAIPTAVVEIAHEGFRKTGEVLCPFVALLWPLRQDQTATIEDDDSPPEVMIGDVPGWAYDVYSREGRAALANFIEGRTETARWVRDHIPPRQRVAFLGGIVFRVEGV